MGGAVGGGRVGKKVGQDSLHVYIYIYICIQLLRTPPPCHARGGPSVGAGAKPAESSVFFIKKGERPHFFLFLGVPRAGTLPAQETTLSSLSLVSHSRSSFPSHHHLTRPVEE